MSPPTTIVIGAGVAGLAAAVQAASSGRPVELYDAAAQAGGRCRSYYDPQIGAVLDNGNHLVLSGNRAVQRYLRLLGAEDRLTGPKAAAFEFLDLQSHARWTVRPNASPLPWWIFDPARRPPGAGAGEFVSLARLLGPAGERTVAQSMPTSGALWRTLIEPFLLAALNTRPEDGSARLAGAIVRGSLARGGDAYRPRTADPSLGAAFVEPALGFLAARGGRVRLGERLRSLRLDKGRVRALIFSKSERVLEPGESVILAVPPGVAQDLMPGLSAPDEFRAILNGHFKLAAPPSAPRLLGLIGGTAEWIFAFDDRISVTVSDADRFLGDDRETLARRLWADVASAFGLEQDLPSWQIVKEKKATFAATPAQDRKRPPARTPVTNLFLAGDWIQTGLPATLEGAVRSGFAAADLAGRAAKV